MGTQVFLHGSHQAQGHYGIGGSIGSALFDGHIVHANLAFAFPNQFFDLGHLHSQPGIRLGFQTQVA